MTTLLAYSATTQSNAADDHFTSLLPIGLCSLFATLREAGKNTRLINLSGMSHKKLQAVTSNDPPSLIGLSQWTHNRHETLERARQLRKLFPNACIIIGGGHATHRAEQLLTLEPAIDLVALGEAEETLLELVNRLEQGLPYHDVPGLVYRATDGACVRTPARYPIPDLDRLPFPARWLPEALNIDLAEQATYISTSRGCPAACHFCASPQFWGRSVRARSVSSVVDEITYLQDQFGLIHLSLRDDTFTADRDRTIALCQEIINRKVRLFWSCQSRAEAIDQETVTWMRQAGCECIQLGVESGSPAILKRLNKRSSPTLVQEAGNIIRQAGLALSIYLISAIPHETPTDHQETLTLVQQLAPDDIQIAPLAYYPGTALYQQALIKHQIPEDLFETSQDAAVLVLGKQAQRLHRKMIAETIGLRHDSSAADLLKCIERDGYHPVLAMRAGDASRQEGSLQQAQELYQSICTNDPDHPWGWFLMAELCEEQGDTVAARQYWQQLLTRIPNNQQAQEGVKR